MKGRSFNEEIRRLFRYSSLWLRLFFERYYKRLVFRIPQLKRTRFAEAPASETVSLEGRFCNNAVPPGGYRARWYCGGPQKGRSVALGDLIIRGGKDADCERTGGSVIRISQYRDHLDIFPGFLGAVGYINRLNTDIRGHGGWVHSNGPVHHCAPLADAAHY